MSQKSAVIRQEVLVQSTLTVLRRLLGDERVGAEGQIIVVRRTHPRHACLFMQVPRTPIDPAWRSRFRSLKRAGFRVQVCRSLAYAELTLNAMGIWR